MAHRRLSIALGLVFFVTLGVSCGLRWAARGAVALPGGAVAQGGATDAPPTRPTEPPPAPIPTPSPLPGATPAPGAALAPSPTQGPPPRVVSSYPVEGDLAVRPGLPLKIVFDRAVDAGSLAAAWSLTPPVEGALAWRSESVVTFTPGGGWTEPRYELHLGAGVRGADGGVTEEPFALRFGVGGRGVPVPVLMYHRIIELDEDATADERTWAVSPAAFEEQMAYLLEHGYETIPPAELADYLEFGAPLPRRPVIVSMDDGSIDVYHTVYPLLRDTPLRPVLFLIPSHMGGYGAYLDWQMARELVEAGFHVGVHSYDHTMVYRLSAEELRVQMEQARDELAAGLGVVPDAFCFPMGGYDDDALAALGRYGYRTAFTLNPSKYQVPDEPYLLSRLRVEYDTTMEEFAELLE